MYFILVLIFSLALTQNFNYSNEDWMTISNPGFITSISITEDEVLFSAENGIYSYNKYTSELLFLEDFVRRFDSKAYHMIHYDVFRDYLWVLTDENISYKPYSSTFWRTIDFHELDLNNHYPILNIGSNTEYLFLNLGSDIITLNPYTGSLVLDDIYDYSDVKWTGSSRNTLPHNFDLSRFHSFEGYSFISNSSIEYMGRFLQITEIASDNEYIWIGTNTGEIFLCDISMRSVEKIKSMPLFSDIRVSYLDDRDEWWFATNDRIALYQDVILANDQIFILRWIENENRWISFSQKKFSNIHSSDITCFYRNDNYLYIGTYKGLLILNINRNKWTLLDENSGLNDNHITTLEINDGNLYAATVSGMSIVSLNNNTIINNNLFSSLKQFTIRDLKSFDNLLYVLSEIGISVFDIPEKRVKNIIDGNFNKFILNNENLLLSKNNKIVKYDMTSHEIQTLTHIKHINDISLCNNYLWISSRDNSILYNLKKNEVFQYSTEDGITGSIVRQIDCDDDWVWFTTDKGLSFYNWRKYHD